MAGKYIRIYLLLLPFLLFQLFLTSGCNPVHPTASAEQFYVLWGKQDYQGMYELLDNASRKTYSEQQFVERYTNIDRGIGLQGVEMESIEETDIAVKAKDVNQATLTLSVKLDTSTVGAIPVQYRIEVNREHKKAPWQLQWHPGLIFPRLGDDSKVELNSKNPRRGIIYDRRGQTLAGPRVFKEVGAVPGIYEDEQSFAEALETRIGLSREAIMAKLHQPWVREGLYVPLTILAPEEENLVDLLLQIPGVMINEVERRYYPAGPEAAHLTGYLGEITAEELGEEQNRGRLPGDLLGKAGLEAVLEQQLAGSKGYSLRIIDAQGKEVSPIAATELVEGRDITLTIDLELQKCAAQALDKKIGAVVALDPRSGEILALCSNPGFDPNRFMAGLSSAEWQTLQEEAQPFLNRALSGIYPPGSAFKPFTAAAAVSEDVLDPFQEVEIIGEGWQPFPSWGDYYVRRVHPEVEKLDLQRAMKYSDNIYFAQAGLALGSERFMEYGRRFGFDEQIPFPLPVAHSRLAREGIKSEIQLADSGYGQGEILVTPLQTALLYSVFAGEGSIPRPRLFLSEEQAIWKEKVISPPVVKAVHDSLVEAVQGKGAPSAGGTISGFTVAGKTGTAEIDTSTGNICWYVTYGPAGPGELPGIVVATVIEGSTMASADALPLGRAVLERYLRSLN